MMISPFLFFIPPTGQLILLTVHLKSFSDFFLLFVQVQARLLAFPAPPPPTPILAYILFRNFLKIIYLFLALLGLSCSAWAPELAGSIVVACGLSGCALQAQ